jgi:predicted metal-dependent peptidase
MTTGTTANKKENDKLKNLLSTPDNPTDPRVDNEVRELLITARVGLLLKQSFFGNLATRLKLVNADEWCPTAATDGRNFYYNTRFIKLLRPKEVEFLFGHEVLHCVYDHFGRRLNRDPQLWNVANDYCVNADLIKYRVGEKITSVPCLYDPKYQDMSSEQIYDILYENADKINLSDLVDKLLDDHLDGNGNGEEQEGDSGPGKMSVEERQKIRDEIREAVLAAAQATENAGSIPLGIRRIIESITEPKMNWRELLRTQLESTIKSDFTWIKASRRGWHMDAVMPGMKNDELIDVAISIDASGSISEKMIKDFLGETGGIMEQFASYRIHVVTFDTQIYNPQQFDSENLDTIADYKVKGGGGTDFDCVFNYFKENNIEPKRHIMFTDGYPGGSWGDEFYCDTVFIIHGNKKIVPPFGQHAYYEEETQH